MTRVAVLASLLLAQTGCVKSATDSGSRLPNIVLVSFDTTRFDHLSAYGYFRDTSPMLRRLAAESVVFDTAFSPSGTTLPTHLSWLTAVYPQEHGITNNVRQGGWNFRENGRVRLVTSYLADLGYQTAAFVGAAPLKRGTGVEIDFQHFSAPTARERRASETVDEVLQYLKSRDSDRPLFLFVHFFDPHYPYEPPPEHDIFRVNDDLTTFLVQRRARLDAREQPELTRYNDAYDGEIHFADWQLGRLLDALRSHGLYSSSVIVVAADHGEGLGQHHHRGHGSINNEQLRVPLVIRYPDRLGVAPHRVAERVSTVDLFPMVLARLDIPVAPGFWEQAAGFDRASARPWRRPLLAQRNYQPKSFAGTGAQFTLQRPTLRKRQYAMIDGPWKLMLTIDGERQLFEIATDPFELEDLATRAPARTKRMADELLERIERLSERAVDHSGGDAFTEQRLEELRALGYVE